MSEKKKKYSIISVERAVDGPYRNVPFHTKFRGTGKALASPEIGFKHAKITLGSFDPGGSIEQHFHDNFDQVFLVVCGHAEWTIDGDSQEVGLNTGIFVPQNSMHEMRVLGDELYAHYCISAPPAEYRPMAKKDRIVKERLV